MPRKKSDSPTTNLFADTASADQPSSGQDSSSPEQVSKGRRKSPLKFLTEAAQRAIAAVTDTSVEAPVAAKPVAEKPKRRPQARAKTVKASETAVDLDAGGFPLPVPTWRSRQAKKAEAVTEAVVSADATPQRPARRAKKKEEQPKEPEKPRGRRAGRQKAAEEEPGAVAPAKPELPPSPPPKPLIPTPAEAPQVVMRNGAPCFVREGRVYPPQIFFGSSPDEKRSAIVLDELRMAGEAGIHIHSHLIDFEIDHEAVDSSVSLAGYLLKKTIEADPEAQVLFRLVFRPARGWESRFKDAAYLLHDGSLAEPSVCDEAFWGEAKECLKTFVRMLRMLDTAHHIFGVHLDRGEWFFPAELGYDTSTSARHKFRDWARTRYLNDEVALRASWFDGTASFENLQIPTFEPTGSEAERFVRSSRKQRRYVDYHLFLSDATVARIGDLAYAVKETSEGRFIVGVSYGYTFEWSHPASGHLSLGKLLRTPEIDFVAGPPGYAARAPGGAAPFPGPIDSFALNSKLFISEEDFKTSIGAGHDPDDFNPIIKTPQALESVHWRGAGCALTHSSGVAWMDLWGNGWLNTATIWERGAKVRETLTTAMGATLSDPEVAVFIDERALAYLVDPKGFQLLVQSVRESVLRAGMSAGFYLLSDLAHRERFPEAKLYLFVNAWDIRPELRAAIKARLQRNNKVLFWLYSAGLFDSGRDSLERAREVTGIALKPQPFYSKSGTTILSRRHPLCEAFSDKGLGGVTKLEPSYFAIPEEATVLGEYSQTGLPSFVLREFTGEGNPEEAWKSVFLGEPIVTPDLLRALGNLAGAHVWNFQNDVVHVRPPFLTVHCSGAGPRTLALPNKFSAYNLLTEKWDVSDATSLRFNATDGSTHLFLVGPKEELESLLSANPEDLLRIEEIPAKEWNQRMDGANFDVPIMKLDEWMVGGEGEEVAEDWLLHPRIVEEPEELAERPRRRPGRRGGRRSSAVEESLGGGTLVDEDLGMHVMFRKRD